MSETRRLGTAGAALWSRLVLLSGFFVACRVGYQQLDDNLAGPVTVGGAGKSSATSGGAGAGDPNPGTAGIGAGGGEANPGGGALPDGGQSSASGGSAGASSGGGAGTIGSGGAASSAGSTSGSSCGSDSCPVGCEGHEYGGHLYAFCSLPLARSEAEAVCETLGLQLVRVDDADELTWLRGVCFAAVGSNNSSTVWPWLGANDIAVPGEWRWVDGTQFWQGTQTGGPVGGLYDNWAQGQPIAKDSCATMQNNATASIWSVQPCTSVHPYTCEGS